MLVVNHCCVSDALERLPGRMLGSLPIFPRRAGTATWICRSSAIILIQSRVAASSHPTRNVPAAAPGAVSSIRVPVYCERELEDTLCPWCIADDSAHKSFDAGFADPAGFADEIPPDIVEEISCRTPGFNTWQQEKWLTCCGDAAAFLEPAGHAEIRARYPQLERRPDDVHRA
jgi:hypothetical protein